ncbi:AAA family ATPase [Defluviimonas sp. D31]|nr:AAA family ATPase [Defluviimonas sp. D31]
MHTSSPTTLRTDAAAPALIVELVGPSGSGKTTLAQAIVSALGPARLAASSRPAEAGATGRFRLPPAAARAAKIARVFPRIGDGTQEEDRAARLLALLPPTGPLWRLRYRRYLTELSKRLARERTAGGIAVFDQGFVTAVGTLASFSRTIDRETLARALEIAPKPDLVIRIETPRETVAARLHDRLGAQSAAERMFELGIPTTLRQIDVFEALDPLLDHCGIPVMRVACPDRASLGPATEAVRARIAGFGREVEA